MRIIKYYNGVSIKMIDTDHFVVQKGRIKITCKRAVIALYYFYQLSIK
ncbi:hypothetical protein pEaSNUABM44_00031 [Erwinia phage pEa_SNUABM_44]|nr:hypothetical protein pEaSNUABM44_00031 [Erwinia phage pEa_SNUABM_44]